MENKIELNDVSKTFENFKLGGISFSVPKGYVTGFIGRNGAGKTTSIRSILSLLKTEGQIYMDGKPIESLDYLQNVGIVMDETFLGKDWTMSIVNQAMRIGYERWHEDLFFDYLDAFKIHHKTKVKELSRGMKIKLMLSIALSHEANLLILDEPTSGLDPMMRDEFTEIIQKFMEEEDRTVLFSTHITQDLEAIADFIIYIEEGQLIHSCSKDEFMDSYRILKGDPKQINLSDSKMILGSKQSMVGVEILVRKDQVDKFDQQLISEIPSIERIMMLYGRKK